MAATITRGIAYFIQGIRDFFYGFYKIVQLKEPSQDSEQPNTVPEKTRVGVLAQRRGTKSRPQVKKSKPSLRKRVAQCAVLNGVGYLFVMLLFQYGMMPFFDFTTVIISGDPKLFGRYMETPLNTIFKNLWVYPMYIISRAISMLWFQDIANAAWDIKNRKLKLPPPSIQIADLLFSSLVQVLILIQGYLVLSLPIPFIGFYLSLLNLSLLYSMYAFDYKWANMGWGINQRIAELENKWPYYLGFGLPLSLLSYACPDTYISGAVISIFFPGLIISANEALPIIEKYDFSLHIFTPALKLGDVVFITLLSRIKRKLS